MLNIIMYNQHSAVLLPQVRYSQLLRVRPDVEYYWTGLLSGDEERSSDPWQLYVLITRKSVSAAKFTASAQE